MGLPRLLSAAALALMASPAATLAQSPGGGVIFCCDDGRGRPVCGDIMPAACYGRAYREISQRGTVHRHVAAPPTREEIARREAEEQRRREEQARLAEQRRLDEVLLETYTGLDDIDRREARALAEIDRSVGEIQLRQAELAEQRVRLELEAEFYAGRHLPRELETGFRMIDAELAGYRSVLESREAEKDAIRARFAADRRRYAELLAAGEGRH